MCVCVCVCVCVCRRTLIVVASDIPLDPDPDPALPGPTVVVLSKTVPRTIDVASTAEPVGMAQMELPAMSTNPPCATVMNIVSISWRLNESETRRRTEMAVLFICVARPPVRATPDESAAPRAETNTMPVKLTRDVSMGSENEISITPRLCERVR
jgi:hypothetical protein